MRTVCVCVCVCVCVVILGEKERKDVPHQHAQQHQRIRIAIRDLTLKYTTNGTTHSPGNRLGVVPCRSTMPTTFSGRNPMKESFDFESKGKHVSNA